MLIGFIIKWSPTQHVSYICKIVDEKLFRTNQNNTHHTRFMKKHQQDILTLTHVLWCLKFPYMLVLAILIKLAVLTGVQMMCGLSYV